MIIIDCFNTTTSNCKKFATAFSEVILVGDAKFPSTVLTSQTYCSCSSQLTFQNTYLDNSTCQNLEHKINLNTS